MIEIVVAGISALAVVLAATLPTYVQNRKILHQVKNSHKSNLRQDIDEIKEGLGDVQKDLRSVHTQVVELNKSDIDARQEHAAIWRAIRSVSEGSNIA